MRCVGYGNDALPSLPLAGVIEDRQTPGRLDDLEIKTGVAAEIGQHRSHAALAEAAILRIVRSIDRAAPGAKAARCTDRDVVRRNLGPPWRGRSELSAFATRKFVLAQIRGLYEGKLILPHRCSLLLRL